MKMECIFIGGLDGVFGGCEERLDAIETEVEGAVGCGALEGVECVVGGKGGEAEGTVGEFFVVGCCGCHYDVLIVLFLFLICC